jgi:hypothetical protein
MTLSLSPSPKLQFFANNGAPLAGGYLYTAAAGAPSVPKATYADAAGTANSNPVLLDSAGRCSLWLDGYYFMEMWTGDKYVAGSTLLWTQDNVSPAAGIGASFAGTVNVQRFDGDGTTTVFTLTSVADSVNNTWVFVEGVYQYKNTYSVSGTTLTFTLAPPSGVGNVEVIVGSISTTASAALSINQDSGTAPPAAGTWATGWIRWNSAPVAGENVGWICTVGGTPGTWAAFGQISL